MSVWGDLDSSYHIYLPGEEGGGGGGGGCRGQAYYVSSQKKLLKVKYGFEGSVFIADLGCVS